MFNCERLVGLVVANTPGYVRRFHALVSEGKCVVPLRSPSDHERMRACGVQEVVEPADETGWLDEPMAWPTGPELAQVAFTSGTEGLAKGILLSRDHLADTVSRLKEKMGLDPSVREYVGVPVYHSFGFARCRAVLSAGGAIYIPRDGFNITELVEMLRGGAVNAVSAVPSLWRLVLRFKDRFQEVAHQLRWIEIGSQAMSAQEKLALRELFRHARIVQHYGLTEASRATFLDVDRAGIEVLDSVGRPTGDVEVDVCADGRIRIRGSNVAREMLVDGQRVPLLDEQGWLTTHDLGEIRGEYLYYLGRADDVINLGGVKVAPEAIEAGMASELGPADSYCVVRRPDALRGDGVLVVATEALAVPDERLVVAASSALRKLGIEAQSAVDVMRVEVIPVTDSRKIRRRELAERYLGESGQRVSATAASVAAVSGPLPLRGSMTQREKDLLGVFAGVFPHARPRLEDSFVGLGGDSLTFVELSTSLEETLGHLPQDWETRTIGALAATAAHTKRTLWRDVDLSVALRAISITAIVAGHFGWLDVGGSTFLLFVVAGFSFGRFQVPAAMEQRSPAGVLRSTASIAAPTVAAMLLLSARHATLDWPGVLLVKNWFQENLLEADFWFVEVLVQILLFMAALLSSARFRRAFMRQPFPCTIGLVLLSVAVMVVMPSVWRSDQVFDRVPHMLIWLFFLGWAASLAQTHWQRAWVWSIAVAATALAWGWPEKHFWVGHAVIWVVVGTALLVTLPRVRVPSPLHRILSTVAGASLFVYISHQSLQAAWSRVWHAPHRALEVALALVAGVAIHAVWNQVLAIATTHLPFKRVVGRQDERLP